MVAGLGPALALVIVSGLCKPAYAGPYAPAQSAGVQRDQKDTQQNNKDVQPNDKDAQHNEKDIEQGNRSQEGTGAAQKPKTQSAKHAAGNKHKSKAAQAAQEQSQQHNPR